MAEPQVPCDVVPHQPGNGKRAQGKIQFPPPLAYHGGKKKLLGLHKSSLFKPSKDKTSSWFAVLFRCHIPDEENLVSIRLFDRSRSLDIHLDPKPRAKSAARYRTEGERWSFHFSGRYDEQVEQSKEAQQANGGGDQSLQRDPGAAIPRQEIKRLGSAFTHTSLKFERAAATGSKKKRRAAKKVKKINSRAQKRADSRVVEDSTPEEKAIAELKEKETSITFGVRTTSPSVVNPTKGEQNATKSEQEESDDDVRYEVRRLLQKRTKEGVTQYRVDWAPDPITKKKRRPTWGDVENIDTSAIANFERSNSRTTRSHGRGRPRSGGKDDGK
ncbi:MAG: hypothetical protein Q9181_002564 [Wetmoreana brouardii]